MHTLASGDDILDLTRRSPGEAGSYAPRVRADPTATLACDAQHTPLDRRCSERTASGILPH